VYQVQKASSAFTTPPPEGFVSPKTWGVDKHFVDRFAQTGAPPEEITMVKDTFHYKSPDKSSEHFIDIFRRFCGPTMNAFDAAEKVEKRRNFTLSEWNWQTRRTRTGTAALLSLPPS